MKIKLCGFSEETSLKVAIDAKTDFIGFIFHPPSPRNISLEKAQHLAKLVPPTTSKVSVTVNASIKDLQNIKTALNPEHFQLHGQESIQEIQEIKSHFPNTKVIKAFNIQTPKDLENATKYHDFIDFYLFDSKIPGSGNTFNWDLLKNHNLGKDFFISGGLNIDNVQEAIKITNAPMIDVSSGIEIQRGVKSPQLINELIAKVR